MLSVIGSELSPHGSLFAWVTLILLNLWAWTPIDAQSSGKQISLATSSNYNQESPSPSTSIAGVRSIVVAYLGLGPVAEPPKLYGPHAPIIVSTTSDCCAREPDNIRSLLGVLGKPESSTFYNSHRINKRVTTILQHLLQIFISGAEEFKTIFYI
jgi:hypothetical protein